MQRRHKTENTQLWRLLHGDDCFPGDRRCALLPAIKRTLSFIDDDRSRYQLDDCLARKLLPRMSIVDHTTFLRMSAALRPIRDSELSFLTFTHVVNLP